MFFSLTFLILAKPAFLLQQICNVVCNITKIDRYNFFLEKLKCFNLDLYVNWLLLRVLKV